MDDLLAIVDPTYTSWFQIDSAIVTWMFQSIEQTIVEPLACINATRELWLTMETMYANKTNINCTVQLFESLFTYK